MQLSKINYKIVVSRVQDISPSIYKQIYGLNYRTEGESQGVLSRLRHSGYFKNNNFLVHIIEKETGKVIGYSIIFDLGIEVLDNEFIRHKNACFIYFWVRKKYRGMGFAKKLFRKSVKATDSYFKNKKYSIILKPHNRASQNFFDSAKKTFVSSKRRIAYF